MFRQDNYYGILYAQKKYHLRKSRVVKHLSSRNSGLFCLLKRIETLYQNAKEVVRSPKEPKMQVNVRNAPAGPVELGLS